MGATHVTATIRNLADPERSWKGLFLFDPAGRGLRRLPAVRLRGVRAGG